MRARHPGGRGFVRRVCVCTEHAMLRQGVAVGTDLEDSYTLSERLASLGIMGSN